MISSPQRVRAGKTYIYLEIIIDWLNQKIKAQRLILQLTVSLCIWMCS
jgi:hypothetical protein